MSVPWAQISVLTTARTHQVHIPAAVEQDMP